MNKVTTLLNNIRNANKSVRQFKIHHFACGYPKMYFISVLAAALLGYGFLLFFPVATIVGVSELFQVARHSPLDINTISYALIWFAILIFCVAMTHHIFTVRFELPKGVSLTEDKAPRLFSVINSKKSPLFWPKFANVLLSDQFELEISKTPVTGVPVWCKNSLHIGFPMMQTLTQPHFNCLLERKILQYSKGRNAITNWLYQLQDIWLLYPRAFSCRKLLGEQLIVWFFKLYAPFYKKFSLYVAQQDELAGDSLMLRHVNDSDLFKSIQAEVIAENFYHKVYLPMLNKFIAEKGAAALNIQPYTNLPKAFRKMVTPERSKHWLDMSVKNAINTRDKVPTLSQRMGNIGHTKIRQPKLDEELAAGYFFDRHYSTVAHFMDNFWVNKINRLLKRRQKATKSAKRKGASANRPQQLVT